MDSSKRVLRDHAASDSLHVSDLEVSGADAGGGGSHRRGDGVGDSDALLLRLHLPAAEVSAEPEQDLCAGVRVGGGLAVPRLRDLDNGECDEAGSGGDRRCTECVVVAHGGWPLGVRRLRWLPTHLDWFLLRRFLWPSRIYQALSRFWSHALVGTLHFSTFFFPIFLIFSIKNLIKGLYNIKVQKI